MPGPTFNVGDLDYVSKLNTLSNAILTMSTQTAGFTAVRGNWYIVKTNAITVTLPATPVAGDLIRLSPSSPAIVTVTLGRNGSNIDSVASDLTLGASEAACNVWIIYVDVTIGWRVVKAAPPTPLRRNMVIGGNFDTNPWQLGTTFTSPSNNVYLADNWQFGNSGTGVVTVSKSADAPTVVQAGRLIQNCMLVDCTTADAAVAAGDVASIRTFVEGYNWQTNGAQRNCVIRFWHKHTKTGTHCVAFRNGTGDRTLVLEYTQTSADTWEEAVLDIPASPSAGTWNYTNGTGLYVDFTLYGGTTFQTTAGAWQTGNFRATANQVNNLDNAANNFRIADVRLFQGTVAEGAQADDRTEQEELLLCCRYLRVWYSDAGNGGYLFTGYCNSTSLCIAPIHDAAWMRVTPAIINSAAGDCTLTGNGGGIALTSLTIARPNVPGAAPYLNISVAAASIAVGQAALFTVAAGAGKYFGLDARMA